jgi:hypothetical protein
MIRTSCQPQVKLSLLRSISLKIRPQRDTLYILSVAFCNQLNSDDVWYVYECESETQ